MSSTLPPSVVQSPLFKLPAELRNQIYGYVTQIGPHSTCRFRDIWYNGIVTEWATHTALYGVRERALLATCRIIRSEAMAKFNALPSYRITVGATFGHSDLIFWSERLRELFSRYIIDHRNIHTKYAEGHDLWTTMAIWMRNAQETFLSGQTSLLRGGSGGFYQEGFRYTIEEVNPDDYANDLGWTRGNWPIT